MTTPTPTADDTAPTDEWASALAEERRKFQAETLTTSFLAGLLRDGWTRCHRCGIRDGERVCVLGNLREWVCSPCLATPPKLTSERDAAPSQAERIAELEAGVVRAQEQESIAIENMRLLRVERDEARAAIARVRALCEQRNTEHADYVKRVQDGTLVTLDRFIGPAQVNVADVLAALDKEATT